MKYFLSFLLTVVVVRAREVVDTNEHDDDMMIWNNHRSVENNLQSSRSKREAVLDDDLKRLLKLPPDYNRFNLPKPNNDVMPLFVHVNISKILDWDEVKEFIKLDLSMQVHWTDFEILKFNDNTHPGYGKALIDTLTKDEINRLRLVNNDPELLSIIWKPNLFIEGLVSVQQPALMAKPMKVRFIPEYGWFQFISRIQITVDCSMDFQYYPADTQVCHIPIRSYAYGNTHVNLSWLWMGAYLTDSEASSFNLRIDDVRRFSSAKNNDPQNVYDVLGFSIFARRRLSYHLIQTYLASSFYIVITTLCFLLPSTMIETRIGMSMTTLLTLTAMFASIRETTPVVSYTKAIDIWMVGCIFFVFLTLFQFTLMTWIKHKKMEKTKKKLRLKRNAKKNRTRKEPSEMSVKFQDPEFKETDEAESVEKYDRMSKFIETYSFPIFLAVFTTYSTVYWYWLLTASNYHKWTVNSTWNSF